MAGKSSGGFGKVVAVVFTSVVAPVLVQVAVRGSHGAESPPHQGAAPASTAAAPGPGDQPARAFPPAPPSWPADRPPAPPAAVAPPAVGLQVVVQGTGRTPAEAVQQALRTALDRAAAAQVDAATWARSGAALRAALPGDGGELIVGWRDLGGTAEWKLRGTVHHRAVAVDVNRDALRDRLRVALLPGGPPPTRGWQGVAAVAQP